MNPILALSTPISTAVSGATTTGIKLAGEPEAGHALSDEQIAELGAALGLQPAQMDMATRSLLQQWWLSGEPLPAALTEGLESGGQLPVLPSWLEGRVSPSTNGLGGKTSVTPQGVPAFVSGDGGQLGDKRLIASVDVGLTPDGDFELSMPVKPELKLAPSFHQVLNGIDQLLNAPASAAVENLQAVVAQAKQALPPAMTQHLLAMPIPQKVGEAAWGQAMADRLIWMVRGDQQNAELKITPPNLGPMEVKLTINNDQASVSFVSHHAQVRDAIEAALPRLREMMAQQSIDLVDVNVGSGHERDQPADHAGDTGQTRHGGFGGADDELGTVNQSVQANALQSGLGLIDLFV